MKLVKEQQFTAALPRGASFTSDVQQRGRVSFPAFIGERIYMRAFTKAAGLPNDLRRWQDTVDQMLDGIDAPGPIYLMVDQAPVRAGISHRRPGAHVDGYWHPGLSCHGGGAGGHSGSPAAPTHAPTTPRHDSVPASLPGHRVPYRHAFGGYADEALLLASDVFGCVAFVGAVSGAPGPGGDCAALDVSGLERVDMAPGRAWAGHAARMLHESIPVVRDCLRTVVRLNVPGAV